MTEHEFEERLRREYRAAASSWTPEKETERALLDKLETAAPHRSAARFSASGRRAVLLCGAGRRSVVHPANQAHG